MADALMLLKEKPKELKVQFEKWVVTQPPWVEALSTGLFGSFQGAFLGSVMGAMATMGADPAAGAAANPMLKMGGPFQQARNFAVMTGVNAGLTSLMKRTRGIDDIQNALVGAFGSGFAFSLISGVGSAPNAMGGPPPNPLMAAVSAGAAFALFQGAFYKLGESFAGPKTNETEYARVTLMLKSLGLVKYEKNIKKGLLNDQTLMLWDGPSLQECKIPPGPRLLILNHIDQYKHLLKPGMPLPSE